MNSRYGRYEVLYKLGQGAMAQVFLARDPVLSRFVAVKVLHADLASRKDVLQRFFNEARTVAVVRNPHVVEVFDFGQEGKDLYLVMEFVDGLSLHGVLKQLRPASPGHVDTPQDLTASARDLSPYFEPLDSTITAALMCQAAEGLTLAAQHGVVHRDIKPENLMINQQGYLKISDFGIAHVQDESITKTGAVLGSPLFMSPEQARGIKPITSQADMFSLGAVFYSCLVGHPPFKGRNLTDLFRKIASEAHIPLWRLRPDLDPALGTLVETLLRKDPAERGAGPRWLHRQLKGYLMALGIMDPAELIAGYLQELSARGIQTTWRMEGPGSPRPATLPVGTLPMNSAATERYTRESDRRMPAAALGAALGILGMAAAGVAWGVLSHMGKPGAAAEARASSNVSGTLASFAVPAGGVPGTARREGEGRETASGGKDSAASQPLIPDPEPIAVSAKDPAEKPQGTEENAILVLKSSPPFAETFVDGNFMGVTPVRLASLPAGRHRVILKVKHAPAFDTVLVLKSGTQAYKFRMDDGAPSRLAATPEDPL
ncbi:MAG: serine/threonine protein kinase [Fibrobacteres bacterium]|nr:serine/threonine protein kinase [Fibrobacterota bacterium]